MKKKFRSIYYSLTYLIGLILFIMSMIDLFGIHDFLWMEPYEGLMISLIVLSINLIDRCKWVVRENTELKKFITDIHDKVNKL